jgi:hypothetical protein
MNVRLGAKSNEANGREQEVVSKIRFEVAQLGRAVYPACVLRFQPKKKSRTQESVSKMRSDVEHAVRKGGLPPLAF